MDKRIVVEDVFDAILFPWENLRRFCYMFNMCLACNVVRIFLVYLLQHLLLTMDKRIAVEDIFIVLWVVFWD